MRIPQAEIHPRRTIRIIVWLAALLAVTMLISTQWGATSAGLQGLWPFSRSPDTEIDTGRRILLDIRLPRVGLAVLAGALLSVGGLICQTLFRNTLATPYITGISSGASLGAIVGLLGLGESLGYVATPLFGFTGGLVAGVLVMALGRRHAGAPCTLLMSGVALGTLFAALSRGLMYVAGERLQNIVFWMMGGLWRATWRDVAVLTVVAVICIVPLFRLAAAMNLLLLGGRTARDLGVSVNATRRWLLVLMCVATSAVVSLTGVIGFIGLIVPHILRRLGSADHRFLIPASALGGAWLLLLADTFARCSRPPMEIPVGILTAIIGAPFFLWLLQRHSPEED